jgi:hypothetical protein
MPKWKKKAEDRSDVMVRFRTITEWVPDNRKIADAPSAFRDDAA